MSNNILLESVDDILSDSVPLRTNNIAADIRQDSILLKLPGELRNVIYELVGVEEASLHVKGQDPPAISNVCRQIRSEFRSIYYSNKVMKVEVWNREARLWHRIEDPGIVEDILVGKDAEVRLNTEDVAELRAWTENLFGRWGLLTLVHDPPGRTHCFSINKPV